VHYKYSTSESDPLHFHYPSAQLARPWLNSDAYPTPGIRQVGQSAQGVYREVQALAGANHLTVAANPPTCIVNNDDCGDSASSVGLALPIARPDAGLANLTWAGCSR
jgi:hypothetical protein